LKGKGQDKAPEAKMPSEIKIGFVAVRQMKVYVLKLDSRVVVQVFVGIIPAELRSRSYRQQCESVRLKTTSCSDVVIPHRLIFAITLSLKQLGNVHSD
jgi:hypothetical protein